MATTPPTRTMAQNGFRNDLGSTNQSAQLNQSLNLPPVTFVGSGQINAAFDVSRGFNWRNLDNNTDISQPFVLAGGANTSIGRVLMPLKPVGNGADVSVSLYADNGSGSPNIGAGPLQTTVIPQQMINQLTSPDGLADSSSPPLSVSQYSAGLLSGGYTNQPYPLPTTGTSAIGLQGGVAQSNTFVVSVGGYDHSSLAAVSSVNTFAYAGTGQMALPTPQPALPTPTIAPAVAVVNDSYVVAMGGQLTNTTGAYSSNVFLASWDNNQGAVGSWSLQAALPVASTLGGAAAWGDYVYYVQGLSAGTPNSVAVYYALVNNGQITQWNAATPIAYSGTYQDQFFTAAINGYLIVAGGYFPTGGGSTNSNVYFAKINADGSLGAWQQTNGLTPADPSLPNTPSAAAPGLNMAVCGDLLLIGGGTSPATSSTTNLACVLAVTDEGPTDLTVNDLMPMSGAGIVAGFDLGGGVYDIFEIDVTGGTGIYNTQLSSVSFVPVPIFQTTTASATYHLVFRMVGGTASDYVQLGMDNGNAFVFTTALSTTRYGTSWSSITGQAVPMFMYDETMGAVGILRHAAEGTTAMGNGNLAGVMAQRYSTFIYTNTISNSNLLPTIPKGLLEVTMAPPVPLNSNPTFTSGVSPWTATNGTLTQSSAQTHGGYALSGLLTPTGGFSQAYVSSEEMPVPPAGNWQRNAEVQAWVLPSGWFYSPTGTSNFSLSVNWFDSSGAYLSTSSNPISLPANTWTLAFNYFKAPVAATYMALVPTEGNSPTSSNLIYMSNVNATVPPEYSPSLTSAAQVLFSGAWPPVGIAQLA